MIDRFVNQRVWRWLPLLIIPPILLLDGLLNDQLTPFAVPVAYLATLPLVFEDRISVLAMLVLVTAGATVCIITFSPVTTAVLIPAWALFNLARRGPRTALIAAIGVFPGVLAASYACTVFDSGAAAGSPSAWFWAFGNIVYCELAVAAGYLVWYKGILFERAHKQRLGEERLRIARDVHDAVAHAMVAINVQSGVAAHLLTGDNEQARTALRHIKQTSGEALTDLRATLGILRDPDQAAPEGPAAGLDDLDAVAERLRASGVSVNVDIDTGGPVPAPLEAATFRIVQEALTNVLRHAAATQAKVTVNRTGNALAVSVSDDGTAAPRNGSPAGVGLRGMSERSAALGGTLTAGPAAGGGWRVEAALPLKGAVA